ncbi:iron complex transport system substrate-binding protein [Devosia sp. YR412]|uniref:ABC transporter substrate-binding protein n=1 Tax=Devosia sp. YR412 TaxID=1881030 RepID=UPI0008BE1F34|nr:ABC transporter substrate-binding protein [Devosia sp. YR412]SEP64509.1 iron complex transport system substrate-binding protein [Devosia sp. YR412]
MIKIPSELAPLDLDGKGSAAADGQFPRDVLHERGALTLKAAPQRLAVISTGQADAATTLGLVPVGATQGHGTGVFEPYLSHYYPQFARQLGGMVDLGDRKAPDVAAFARLKPDLICMNEAGKNEDSRAALSVVAPVLVTRGKGFNWKVDFLLLAHAVGRVAVAQALLDSFHAAAAAANLTRGTVSFVQSNGHRLTIMGKQSFAGSIADDLGLARPEAQSFVATSRKIEATAIADVDADWVIYGGQGAGVATIKAMPGWDDLPAVRAGRAIEVDYQPFFNNAGPTAARIVLDQLSAILSEQD